MKAVSGSFNIGLRLSIRNVAATVEYVNAVGEIADDPHVVLARLSFAKDIQWSIFMIAPLRHCPHGGFLTAQICAAHLRRSGEIWASARELHAASFEHVGIIGEPQSHGSHLLDQYDCCSLVAECADCVHDLLHDKRCQPHRWLVHQDKARLAHQTAGNGEHLLLAAR
jgi:hypothetical protein